ncbi:MAG: sulfotransferase [Coleofasciculus chthonoplastes F3-SA18-01]|uniref:sulfotransferase domain-containing protein n=1 Tax=Coleofasciculus chthonoplastes TaxID=64178 RepID=UPI0032F4CB57
MYNVEKNRDGQLEFLMKQPTFIVIGAHKAATTSMHNYLKQHPEVYLISNKGKDRLSSKPYISSLEEAEDYLNQFEGATTEKALGEVSSVYLHGDGVAARIQPLFPDIKIIAVLRNPAERAYSHILSARGEYFTPQEINNFDSVVLSRFFEKEKFQKPGLYYSNLKKYFDLFNREQIKNFLYDDIVHRKAEFFRELLNFIGVDSSFEFDFQQRYHKGKLRVDNTSRKTLTTIVDSQNNLKNIFKMILKPIVPQIKSFLEKKQEQPLPPLSDHVRTEIINFYRDDIIQLQELTGLNCSHWLEGKPT